jgi:hypothetical protein
LTVVGAGVIAAIGASAAPADDDSVPSARVSTRRRPRVVVALVALVVARLPNARVVAKLVADDLVAPIPAVIARDPRRARA